MPGETENAVRRLQSFFEEGRASMKPVVKGDAGNKSFISTFLLAWRGNEAIPPSAGLWPIDQPRVRGRSKPGG
jgi:hypothetical protein